MKLLLALIILLAPIAVSANTLSLETGAGVRLFAFDSNGYETASLALKTPLSRHSFVEYRLGRLDNAATYSAALGLTTTGRTRLNASIGGAYLDSTPAELTGNLQFLLTVGLEHTVGRYTYSLNARHLSNGSKVFGHNRRPNDGVEHIYFGVGINF